MNKAIIIGASSGIGRELAIQLGQEGYEVALTARRVDLLEEAAKQIPKARVCRMDVAQADLAIGQLSGLIEEMGGVDLVVISAGLGHMNDDLEWDQERETIDVNVTGFAAMANVAMRHFIGQGRGHLVSISSIAALRGGATAPAYNASKAFESNYMQGLRQKAVRSGLPIVVTDIQPGFVDTDMAKGDLLFWVAPAEKAARQILAAIKHKRAHAYVTRRWRLFAWLIRLVPDFIYNRIG